MLGSLGGLSQLCGDGGGQGAHRIKDTGGQVHRMTGGHEHGHGLAEPPAHTEHDRTKQTVLGRRQDHFINHLPAGGPHGLGRLAVPVRHRLQGVLGNGGHDRRRHEPQDHPGVQDIEPHRHVKDLDNERVHDGQPDKAPDNRRDGGQQLHQDFEGLAFLAGGELADIDGGAQGKGNRHHHGQPGDAGRARHQGEGAEFRQVLVGRFPVGRGEEFLDVHGVDDEIQAFLGDEDKDAEDEDDGGDPGHEDEKLHEFVDVPIPVAAVEVDRVHARSPCWLSLESAFRVRRRPGRGP